MLGAGSIVGAGLAVAGRIVNISRDLSIVSYLIVVGLAEIVVGVTATAATDATTATT